MKTTLLFLVALAACLADAADKQCACPFILDPVCGVIKNGKKTFSNECVAKCAGVTVFDKGECEKTNQKPDAADKQCACPLIMDPVCGVIKNVKKTFPNECVAKCAGVTMFDKGECEKTNQKPDAADKQCACPLIMDPVCGVIKNVKKTFPNECVAKCAGVTMFDKGECEKTNQKPDAADKQCACPLIMDPVCGVIKNVKKTFPNECVAKCAGVTMFDKGECEKTNQKPDAADKQCACPLIMDPVCGVIKKTFSNECVAKCAGVTMFDKGGCEKTNQKPEPCKCDKMLDRVCGKDGKTYNNPCLAGCANTSVDHKGPCRR